MKLMGRHLLHQLAAEGSGEHAGSVGALCAELEAAEWTDVASALEAFPAAIRDGHCIDINTAAGASVRLAINCAAGVVLVESVRGARE
jgi:hypothetical protein